MLFQRADRPLIFPIVGSVAREFFQSLEVGATSSSQGWKFCVLNFVFACGLITVRSFPKNGVGLIMADAREILDGLELIQQKLEELRGFL